MRLRTLAAALCLCLAATVARAGETYQTATSALRLPEDAQARPGDPIWPLGERAAALASVRVEAAGEAGFRLVLTPRPGAKADPAAPRACAGLESAERLDLYRSRAVQLRVRASRPAAGILVMTTSNTQDLASRDRFYGAFVVGREWKTLSLRYGTLTPLPGWEALAARQGLRPGDRVLRPDSVEDFCIGAEAGRLAGDTGQDGPLVIEIQDLRFVR